MIFDGGEFQVFPWKFSQRACKPEKQHGVWWRPAELKFTVSSLGWRCQKMWLSKTLWSYCFYRCLTWNLYIWVMSFNLVGVCLRNREIQAKQAHYETTNSLYATRRRKRRMKSAAGIQKCCGLAVFICVTNWWLDEWIIIKIIYSMALSQEGMMHRELQSRLISLAEVAGVRGHFGTCAATSENCQTIQDRWASTQVVVLHRSSLNDTDCKYPHVFEFMSSTIKLLNHSTS